MVNVNCAACGDPFEARSRRAKWCSERCRKRVQRAGGEIVELKPKVAVVVDSDAAGRVYVATLAALEAGDRVGHPAGALALELAMRVDARAENGSSTAALAKELRASLAEALENAKSTVDDLDELRRRRAARVRGA